MPPQLRMPRVSRTKAGSEVNLLIKYALFFVNFLIWMASGALAGLTAWVLYLKEKKVNDVYDFFFDPSIILCLVGCLAFVISFCGWFGAFRENVIAIRVYTGLMTFFFFVQILFVILIFVTVYSPQTRETLGLYPEKQLKNAIDKYDEDEDLRNLINTFQETFGCCGTTNDEHGYKDWGNNEYYKCANVTDKQKEQNVLFCSVPYSCCKKPINDAGLKDYQCGQNMQSPQEDSNRLTAIYTNGCIKAITDMMQANVIVVGGVLLGIFLPQIFLTWMASTLKNQILRQMAKWNQPG